MTELQYQSFIRDGYRIIRTIPEKFIIEIKRRGSKGWTRLAKCASRREMELIIGDLVSNEKTILE